MKYLYSLKLMVDSLKMWQKFALIGVLVLALFGLPFYLYVSTLNENIVSIKMERVGARVMPDMIKVIRFVQKHQGLNRAVMEGNSDIKATLDTVGTETSKAVDALQASVKEASELNSMIKLLKLRKNGSPCVILATV